MMAIRMRSRPASPSCDALFLAGQYQGNPRVERPALKIMGATTVMGVIMIVWCL